MPTSVVEASEGKTLTVSTRRVSSLLSRSMGLVLCRLVR
jgi:hypothetical protein